MKDYKVCFADGNEKLYGAENILALVEFLNEALGEYAATITRIEEVQTTEKQYIAWYRIGDEEDYTLINAVDEEEARRRFHAHHDNYLVEIHEVQDDEQYLAYC